MNKILNTVFILSMLMVGWDLYTGWFTVEEVVAVGSLVVIVSYLLTMIQLKVTDWFTSK